MAHYTCDIAGEMLNGRADEDSIGGESYWSCSICDAKHPNKQTKWCGTKRREHVEQWKVLHQLEGVMPGKAAIVSVQDDEHAFRSVLFGPHPEMGNADCVGLLLASMRWAAGEENWTKERVSA